MVSPLGIPLYMPNAAAAAVTMRHDLQGQSFRVGSACAAGAHAIGSALRMIQYGDADAVVCGGAEAALTEFAFACFETMQALSPTGISRPFDARRDGFVMGEGAGMLVLEEAEAAHARGATILGELAGYGSTTDAHHLTAPEPTGGPASRAIELALADAGATPERRSTTSTPTAPRRSSTTPPRPSRSSRRSATTAKRIPISSTKSSIGHLLGAAGAVEAVATVRTLQHRRDRADARLRGARPRARPRLRPR